MRCQSLQVWLSATPSAKTLESSLPRSAPVPIRLFGAVEQELRPLLVRYVFREQELESAMRSHDEGPQKATMLMGIKGYHQAMLDQNPPLG